MTTPDRPGPHMTAFVHQRCALRRSVHKRVDSRPEVHWP